MRFVLHSVGHIRAVEIRTQAYMIRAYELHGVIDVFDDLSPFDARELALRDVISCNLIPFGELAPFIFTTTLLHFFLDGLADLRIRLLRVAKFLAEEADMIIDLYHAAFGRERFDHIVGHIPRGVADG